MGKARKPYEFGVKASIDVTHMNGLMVGASTFPGNRYDAHILSAQLEQTRILFENVGREHKEALGDLSFRSVDRDNSRAEIIHRGKYKALSKQQHRWLNRRQAVSPPQWRGIKFNLGFSLVAQLTLIFCCAVGAYGPARSRSCPATGPMSDCRVRQLNDR
jgi:hypothetical protein